MQKPIQAKSQVYDISTFDLLDRFVSELLDIIKIPATLLLSGSLGAGKTTFVSKLCIKLGVRDQVQSPTYFYTRKYNLNDGKVLLHLDLYRLHQKVDPELLMEFAHDIAENDFITCVEWPVESMETLTGIDSLAGKHVYKLNFLDKNGGRSVEVLSTDS